MKFFGWKCILNQNIQRQPAILVMVAKGVPKPETDVDSIHSQPGVFQHLTGMATILLQEKNSPIRKRKLYFPARECKNWESHKDIISNMI